MKQGELQQLLAATNRWRRDPANWQETDADLRAAAEAPFHYTAGVLGDLEPGGLYVLRGPRRVGKSVELKRTIASLIANGADPRRITHFAVDGWRADELRGLIRATRAWLPDHGLRYWFLDEITGVRGGWANQIKWLRDNDPHFRSDTVVLTGSSATDLTDSIGTLAGRRGRVTRPDRTLLPMGFRSFARFTLGAQAPRTETRRLADLARPQLVEIAGRLSPWLDDLTDAWDTYLQVGGFPRAVSSWMTTRAPDALLAAELMDQLHGRAFRSGEWSRPQSAALLDRIARGLGSPTNVSATARSIGVQMSTTRRRLDDLHDAFVTWPCYLAKTLRPQLRAQEKIYFTDPIFGRLTGGQLPDVTQLSEQQLGMVLMRRAERRQPGAFHNGDQVLYHRNGNGREIDFVGPGLGSVAIESKYVDGDSRRGLRTLRASPWPGIVATRSELNLDDPELPAVPASLLAWMLDT